MTAETSLRHCVAATGLTYPSIHVEVLGKNIGVQVPLGSFSDAEIVHNRAVLDREGVRGAGVSGLTLPDLAVSVVPDRERTRVDMIVIATNSTALHASEALCAAVADRFPHLSWPRILLGYECANVAPTLLACQEALANGTASRILVIFVEKIEGDSRYTPVSNSLYSDVALACVVSQRASLRSFRLDAVEIEPSQTAPVGSAQYADARNTLVAMRAAVRRALAAAPDEAPVAVITLNLGATARQLLMMSTALPRERLLPHPDSAIGHSFGADLLIGLDAIADSGSDLPNRVLALGSSRAVQSAMLFTRDV